MQIKEQMKLFTKLFIYTFFIFTTPLFSTQAGNPNPDKYIIPFDRPALNDAAETELQVNSLLAYARRFRGVPYRYGGMSPKGFDCSGFTSYVFKEFGYQLARRGSHQFHNGERVKRSELQPGDLVFFGGRGNGPGIGHVGIVTAVDGNGSDFTFIHASSHRGITESHSTESYYRARYRNACRIINKGTVGNKVEELTAENL